MKNGDRTSTVFPGRIALITGDISVNDDAFDSVEHLTKKYGAGKISHFTWPVNFLDEQEKMADTVAALIADRDIKALIINQAVWGSNAMVDRIKEGRDDIYVVYCTCHEPVADAILRANLIFRVNDFDVGPVMVKQAIKQGAKTFVHYSFPRHMIIPGLTRRRDMIRDICETEDIRFVDTTVLDPQEEAGNNAAKRYILDDVPRLVARYGEDTAFFCTNCMLQAPLIRAVVDSHAIYPQPCCPSPYHGFPEAFGIESSSSMVSLSQLIAGISQAAREKNMTGRLSSWPVSAPKMFTNVGAEYAINRINGEVPRAGIDTEALKDCMSDYIIETSGTANEVFIKPYSERGITYDNFKLIHMSYLDF